MKNLTIDNATIVADASLVRRCLSAAAVRDPRYYLQGVCIRPADSGGVHVMASDGILLLVLHDPKGKADREVILPFSKKSHAGVLALAGSVCCNSEGTIYALDDDGKACVYVSPVSLIDGRFPDVKAVVGSLDEYSPGLAGEFQPALLSRIAGFCTASRVAGVRFFQKKVDGRGASLFLLPDGFGLVMPLKEPRELRSAMPRDFGGQPA